MALIGLGSELGLQSGSDWLRDIARVRVDLIGLGL